MFRVLWRGWETLQPNPEGRPATCRPRKTSVIVPMCSALGPIPQGTVCTVGHLKAKLDVAAIKARTSTQGSNLFQFLECARVGEGSLKILNYVCVDVCDWGG